MTRESLRSVAVFCLIVTGAFTAAIGATVRHATNPWDDSAPAQRAIPHQPRPPMSAGQFYPKDAGELASEVARLLSAEKPLGLKRVRAILVPHAGFVFSGEIAATAFREIPPDFRRVILIAANHNAASNFQGVAVPNYSHYAFPGREIALADITDEMAKSPLSAEVPEAHGMHMLEVELPFLAELNRRAGGRAFTIVPLIAGRMDTDTIADFAETLARYADEETVFVFSVDLSHYYPATEAERLDRATIDALMSMDKSRIPKLTTDGNQVLLTLITMAELLGWEPTFLKYAHSGMKSGDPGRVVGYSALAFHEPFTLRHEAREKLRAFAFAVASSAVRGEPAPAIPDDSIFGIRRAAFVTLRKHGELRGCIGNFLPQGRLAEAIAVNASKAALADPRFPPVTPDELNELEVTVSVLGYPIRLGGENPVARITQRRDGVIMLHNGKSSTFLPEVWETFPDKEIFLAQLCRKQGAGENCWRDPLTVFYTYGAYAF